MTNWYYHAPVDLQRAPARYPALPRSMSTNQQGVTVVVPEMDNCRFVGDIHIVPDETMDPGQVNSIATAEPENKLAVEVAKHLRVFGEGLELPRVTDRDSDDLGPRYRGGSHVVEPTPEQRTAMVTGGPGNPLEVPVRLIVKVAPGSNVRIQAPAGIRCFAAQGLGAIRADTPAGVAVQPYSGGQRPPTRVAGNANGGGYFAPPLPGSGVPATRSVPPAGRGTAPPGSPPRGGAVPGAGP